MMSVLIEIQDLVKKYGDFVAVDGISFQIQDNECFGVLGPNGAGKTTVIKMLTATSPVSSGILSVAGMHVGENPRGIKGMLGVVPQDDNLDPDLPVRKNLEVYARYHNIDHEIASSRIDEALELFQLTDRAESDVDDLSGGMKRRLTIARALVNDPKVLILDEPTTGLDPINTDKINQLINKVSTKKMASIIVTHEIKTVYNVANKVIMLYDGSIIFSGSPEELKNSENKFIKYFITGTQEKE